MPLYPLPSSGGHTSSRIARGCWVYCVCSRSAGELPTHQPAPTAHCKTPRKPTGGCVCMCPCNADGRGNGMVAAPFKPEQARRDCERAARPSRWCDFWCHTIFAISGQNFPHFYIELISTETNWQANSGPKTYQGKLNSSTHSRPINWRSRIGWFIHFMLCYSMVRGVWKFSLSWPVTPPKTRLVDWFY